MKIIPTSAAISDLTFNKDVHQDTKMDYNKHITGTITIDFVTSGDFSSFVVELDKITKVTGGLDSVICNHLLKQEFEL